MYYTKSRCAIQQITTRHFAEPLLVIVNQGDNTTSVGFWLAFVSAAASDLMDATFSFTVNGRNRTVITDPQRPLLEVLREDLQLTGTKYGCGEGQCRACTVLLNGKSVASCVTPISAADKQTVLTIEGLAKDGKLHPVQEAFLAAGASQCGYCTPGMIMGVVGVLAEDAKLSRKDLTARMEKHLCRCCNYPKIARAIERASELSPSSL
jgi:carbon-monoxide dehydrogenase small subunit